MVLGVPCGGPAEPDPGPEGRRSPRFRVSRYRGCMQLAASHPLLVLPALLAASTTLESQTIVPLIEEGDPVPGIGPVTRVDGLEVNDAGTALLRVDTGKADQDQDEVLMLDLFPLLQEGGPLSAPPGATVDAFDSLCLNDNLQHAFNLFLSGTPDSAVYFGLTQLVIAEGGAPPVAGLTPGTPFRGFFDVKLNDAGALLVLATVDDPAIPTSVDQVLLAAAGGAGPLAVIAKEGDVLPGETEALETFSTGPHEVAWREDGTALFFADLTGPTATDGALFTRNAPGATALLAKEGAPSPVSGRNWLSLAASKLDLNASGGYVHTGQLDGDATTNFVIVRSGALFRQEGESLPAIAPFQLTSFGLGPVCIDDQGDVVWFGDWNDPDTSRDTGLFHNDVLLVQEGVTQVGGVAIEALHGSQDGYTLSDNGRYLAFEADLADGTNGAYRIDLGSGVVTPMQSCTLPPALLAWTGGAPKIGGALTLSLDGPQAAGVLPFLGVSTLPVPGYPPCGLSLPPFGEILIGFSVPNPVLVLAGPPSTGAATVFLLPVPAQPSLLGASFYAQGLYADVLGLTAEPFRLSNGMEIGVGL